MKEKTLLKLALIVSLIGVVCLYYITEFTSIEEEMIENIDMTDVDKDLFVKGRVEKVTDMDKVMFIDVSQPDTIKVVAFKDGKINLEEGDYVYVSGTVEEYKGEPEIIANEIKKE